MEKSQRLERRDRYIRNKLQETENLICTKKNLEKQYPCFRNNDLNPKRVTEIPNVTISLMIESVDHASTCG